MTTALVPLIDGFEETEAIAMIDVLRRAGFAVTTAGIGKRQATGSHDITVQTDAEFAQAKDKAWDAVVLPGGPGTKRLGDVAGLQDLLKQQAEAGRLVAAICAAPSILAAAGLLRGKRAACFPSVEDAVKAGGATLVHDRAVRDGNAITSRGMGTAIDFGLVIVEHFQGREAAEKLAAQIVYR